MAHTIRLRGPWTVRYERRFHKPTGLSTSSRVWLVIEDIGRHASVNFNSQCLGEIGPDMPGSSPARFEITRLLEAQNMVSIDVASSELVDGLTELVSLEIE